MLFLIQLLSFRKTIRKTTLIVDSVIPLIPLELSSLPVLVKLRSKFTRSCVESSLETLATYEFDPLIYQIALLSNLISALHLDSLDPSRKHEDRYDMKVIHDI